MMITLGILLYIMSIAFQLILFSYLDWRMPSWWPGNTPALVHILWPIAWLYMFLVAMYFLALRAVAMAWSFLRLDRLSQRMKKFWANRSRKND